MNGTLALTLPFAAGFLLAGAAQAQPYEVDWYTIDGGGGASTGGTYSLSGSIGQHDAGGPMLGAGFELAGGFWTGASVGCNIADVAPPFGTLDFTDVLSFLIGFSAEDPGADLAPPFGTLDFSDVLAFLTAFGAGCP